MAYLLEILTSVILIGTLGYRVAKWARTASEGWLWYKRFKAARALALSVGAAATGLATVAGTLAAFSYGKDVLRAVLPVPVWTATYTATASQLLGLVLNVPRVKVDLAIFLGVLASATVYKHGKEWMKELSSRSTRNAGKGIAW